MKKSYFRPEIDALAGYVPGEQPKMPDLVKINTNENPYPPSAKVMEALKHFDSASLRLYPDPTADGLRKAVAERYGVAMENVIAGNGSDDLLTMIFRAFTSPERSVAVLEPSYSLYPVLAAMQGAEVIRIPLNKGDFTLPEDFLKRAEGANLLMIARPNAPTGNVIPKAKMVEICRAFDGIVGIDEAYADFADDNCMDLAVRLPNVIVMRTFSKSYSMAGMRLGYAVAEASVIDGLMKLKDSYNVDRITQTLGLAAFLDTEHLAHCCARIRESREQLTKDLKALKFTVIPSQSNFLFAAPPDGNGERCFKILRDHAVIVRYFPGPVTGKYLRISIGTPGEIGRLLQILRETYL